ncbi:predicted helicase [Firmicutes bacterium CAG:460]|nr:predicted helicase [Firmicutes bacterium CAG:460]
MQIENLTDLINKTNIRAYVNTTDIVKGKTYDKEKITFKDSKETKGTYSTLKVFNFEVDSETKPTYYDVSIVIEDNKEIVKTICDCKEYRNFQSCKHIGAVFVNYYETLFKGSIINVHKITEDILNKFMPDEDILIKKELQVELIINVTEKESYYYYYGRTYTDFNIKIMIGEDKLYTLGNHATAFKVAYENQEGEVYFGKNFTYIPEKYYLSSNSKTIIESYLDVCEGSYNRNIFAKDFKTFLNKIKNTNFIINNYKIEGIKEGFPISSNLIKNNESYELDFDLENIEVLIKNDYEYILYKGNLYHLRKLEQELIDDLMENKLDKLIISKEKVDAFTKGLLKIVRKNLKIDASVTDITLPKEISTKLYFDLRSSYILVDALFNYDEKEVNYFDKSNTILRDIDYETKVINDILKYGFEIDNNKIILKDIEKEVEFLENGLENLATKYEIFTTEKFKGINIKKKTSVTSMFGIGQDNILSYTFSLGDINSNELVNIFEEIKNKKKYYRLKNGDILNLEDESLKELSDLKDDLELSDAEIIAGHGAILKYRAIYLDSLKNTKYNIIKTDNLFDNFIDKFYKFKDINLTLPKDELKILRDYQVTGVKWLYTLAKTGFGGILADEMGLGKTIQVIYYIKQMLKDNENNKFLIVVPTSLSYNWDHEFDSFGSNIKRKICVGNKDKRTKILSDLNDTNVIITTYGLLREDEELYNNLNFNTMVIDEAQNIKNNMAGITKVVKKVNAETKFALTGTPLENSILELWSIFDFIMPGYLASLTKFQSKYKIKDFDEDSEILIKGLSKQINPFILRRKKQDVVKELPDKLINDIYIELKDEQKKLYVAELERVKEEMEKIIETEGMNKARFLILQLLTKLRQICIDPNIVYDNYKDGSNKLEQLESIVNEYIKNNHKILIFSSFKTALNIVKEKLNKAKIKTYMIDGSVPAKDRIEMVDNFNNNDDVKVFLIMLKSGGTGLNLATADVVIHLDLWWNPQAENQATDRAHRIGQKNTVEVIHLITKGTIEEKILELQNKKRILSDKLIDGEIRDKNILSELTKEDIKNLLSYENKD